ncbi:hypothetical protein MtrunA17_Chr8g0355361 [Medicago truncatula]|uniref:DUF674 family protein n=2 Tax=Medicago truncatula TaxID=3880 RepID=A0A396GGY4_MEDTR|nr:hypothetical protein MtrunA17_Chr8g0355361 [Medicago truncatula]
MNTSLSVNALSFNMASSSTKVTLRLLVDTKQNKVMFAESSQAAIDSLLNMFRLSFGTVVRLMSYNDMHLFGSLGNLYHTSTTVQNLNQNYVLFDPTIPNDDHSLGTSFYMCPNGCT